MIYEIAHLPVHAEHADKFRQAFAEVLPLLSRAQGYQGHVLAKGIETPEIFNLIVRWRSLEDHTPVFEASDDHEVFMRGIQEYFSAEPKVYHFEGGAFSASEHDAFNTPV
ncbi:antibiotic biosynthesis monooxygenase family protein [Pararhizobium sp. PWRC1-1]|uniref:antibiotic biosynthesis monooxygenase family protein n=1 Tax=Pararhizobium sp. PWRC1-1 TaxID=2804566 RepID=UPI003CF1420F